jgi:2-desacetyl-2-hydroxyethyl bacteriochlorophyllide A dehydrogenase
MSTSQALVLEAPRTIGFRTESFPALKPGELRLRTLFSGVSAGTELTYYRGTNPYLSKRWDEKQRLFFPAEQGTYTYPVTNLGYEEVGEVIEVGPDVTDVPLGVHVFGTWGHRTHHVANLDYVRPRLMPAGADPIFGIFSHLGAIALNGVHDAAIKLGDTVAIFGLGGLGQIVALMARRAGARVIGVELHESRLALAQRLGIDHVVNPAREKPAEVIKALTDGRGADVCIEVSGAAPALHEAIRSAGYSARVVAMGFIQGEPKGLFLGEEFHHNRINLVCSQISGVAPERSYQWNKPRLWRTAVELQAAGQLDLRPIITHRVPFAEAAALYAQLDQRPQDVVHAVLEFPAAPGEGR